MVTRQKAALILLFLLIAASCRRGRNAIDRDIAKKLSLVDSLADAGYKDTAFIILTSLRPVLRQDDPNTSTYYYWQAAYNHVHPNKMARYADSALAFFKSERRKRTYPDEYYDALLVKGDVEFLKKHYYLAFNYYFKANSITLDKRCDHGDISSKIAMVYYLQKDYLKAARNLVNSYHKLNNCHSKLSPRRAFYLRQGILDNAALSYEKAGKYDSARYYYNRDIAVIKEAAKDERVDKNFVDAAKLTLYDNLGGLNLREGHINEAESLLTRCLHITVNGTSDIYITPMLKLANLHLEKERHKVADSFLTRSRALLDSLPEPNAELEIRWYKTWAKYLDATGNITGANKALKKYSWLRDSFEHSYTSLYRLNVDRELDILQHQQEMTNLQHRQYITGLYVTTLVVAVIMALIIIVLITRSLKTARKYHRETSAQNAQLQTAVAEAERANKNYVRIMRVMAHDLSNPISGMTGLAHILVNEPGNPEENRHMLELIETTGTHAIEMIKELLKTGLADENEPITTQPENINEILEETISLLQFKAKDKHQELILQHDNIPVIANVNREKIWRVFNNLISNAIKFTHTGGRIVVTLSAKAAAGEILISIADNGIGIPAEVQDNVFEMFTPAKRTGTSGEQPFGLGLSISKKIIEKHKGRIWFESDTSKGTTFFISLPYKG